MFFTLMLDINDVYCKTCNVRVPFIPQTLQPWRFHGSNRHMRIRMVSIINSTRKTTPNLRAPNLRAPKFTAAKIKGFTVCKNIVYKPRGSIGHEQNNLAEYSEPTMPRLKLL